MKSSTESWALEPSIVSEQLKRFVAEKVAHASAAAVAEGKEMWPQFKALFASAERGNLQAMREIFDEIRRPAPKDQTVDRSKYCSHGSQWSTALELWGALEQFSGCGEKFTVAFGQEVIASIPPGSVYFGGTDSGRFVVTALCESHVSAVPFFTLTQNALADRGYRQYLRSIYGSRLHLPSEEEAAQVHTEYLEDAQRRREANQLRPGESLEFVDAKWEVRGQIGVMALNGRLSKLVFEKNPEREFYVEESFPLEWMYSHLTPHGLILKINRQPLAELPTDVIEQDRDYWTSRVRSMIGDWLRHDTPLGEVAAFLERVHLRHDLRGFDGDARFVQNDPPQRLFSKLRSSIGGVYAWRATNLTDALNPTRMIDAADFAFRQAWALCPRSPEAVFGYINLLVVNQRHDEALLIADTATKLDSDNMQLKFLTAELQRMKMKQSQAG